MNSTFSWFAILLVSLVVDKSYKLYSVQCTLLATLKGEGEGDTEGIEGNFVGDHVHRVGLSNTPTRPRQ